MYYFTCTYYVMVMLVLECCFDTVKLTHILATYEELSVLGSRKPVPFRYKILSKIFTVYLQFQYISMLLTLILTQKFDKIEVPN